MHVLIRYASVALLAGAATLSPKSDLAAHGSGHGPASVRFATFNASLNRNAAGQLVADLTTPANQQARNVAETIQRVRPDVLLINEFDFDESGEAARLFQDN
jgi:hypothetical protein